VLAKSTAGKSSRRGKTLGGSSSGGSRRRLVRTRWKLAPALAALTQRPRTRRRAVGTEAARGADLRALAVGVAARAGCGPADPRTVGPAGRRAPATARVADTLVACRTVPAHESPARAGFFLVHTDAAAIRTTMIGIAVVVGVVHAGEARRTGQSSDAAAET